MAIDLRAMVGTLFWPLHHQNRPMMTTHRPVDQAAAVTIALAPLVQLRIFLPRRIDRAGRLPTYTDLTAALAIEGKMEEAKAALANAYRFNPKLRKV